MIRDGVRATVRLTAWTAGLVLVARLLLAAGTESLSVPLTSGDDLSTWVSETPPADMAIALLRLAALAAVAYLLAVTALAVLARVVRIRGLVAVVDRISPGVVRRVVTGGSGLGLVLGGAVAWLPVPDLTPGSSRPEVSAVAAPPGATMTRLPAATATMTQAAGPTDTPASAAEPATGEATMTRIDSPPRASATMTRLEPSPPTPPGTAAPPVEAAPAAYEPRPTVVTMPAAATPQIDPTRWIVEPGDSLWSIAQDVMAPSPGAGLRPRAVTRYWRQLVEANRAQLVDPGNPDLLVPGQSLVVPPPDD